MRFKNLLLAAVLAALALPSQAAVLFVGTEDVSFLCHNVCTVSTDATKFRPSWSREAYTTSNNSLAAPYPSGNYFTTPTFAAQGTLWLHAQYFQNNNTRANYQLLWFYGADGTPALMLQGTGTNGQLKISSINEAGSVTDLATCSADTFPSNALDQLDVKVVYAVAGSVTIYQNSTQICTFSGDVTTNGRTTLNQVALGTARDVVAYWSEVAVTTYDTRGENVRTFVTNLAGNVDQWAGANACTNILNGAAWNDSVFISTVTSNLIEQCGINATIPPGSYALDAVVMTARGLVGTVGPQTLKFVTRIGGVDYLSSGTFSPTFSMSNIAPFIQETNPATAAPWNPADPAQAGFNIGIKSTP